MKKSARHKVIDWAVFLESNISLILSHLLGISDMEKSKSLGYGTSALSFNAKLNLLTDINALEKEEKTKFEYFAQIRNKFAHNAGVVDFCSCFDKIDGLENKVKKVYSEIYKSDKSREEKLNSCFNLLIKELWLSLIKLYKKIENNAREDGRMRGTLDGQKSIINALKESIAEITSLIPDGNLIREAIFIRSSKKAKTK